MMINTKEGYVTSHTEHGITTIEFFHPQSNSLPLKLLDALAQEIHYAGTHDSKVVVLKSAGNGAFCAGASFDELIAIKRVKRRRGKSLGEFRERYQMLCGKMYQINNRSYPW